MKPLLTKRQRAQWGLVVIALVVTGCRFSMTPTARIATVAPSEMPTRLPVAPTPTPTASVLPTTTPSSTPTPVLPSTNPNMEPTLTNQQGETLQKLLQPIEGCPLPCWWGVVPGQTRWTEAEATLNHLELGGVSSGEQVLHGMYYWFEDVYGLFDFEVRDGQVVGISVQVGGELNPDGFRSQWSEFSPKKIITSYGTPSLMWIRSNGGVMGGYYNYGLYFFYDHLGFAVEYDLWTKAKAKTGTGFHACPQLEWEQVASDIKLKMQSPDRQRPLRVLFAPPEWSEVPTLTLEEATGITAEDLYQRFQQDQPACFDTFNSDVWPTPQ